MLPLKMVLIQMERDNVLDVDNRYHLGAVQAIGCVLLQHAVDQAVHLWNVHPLRARGGGRSLGSPTAMRANAPPLAIPRLPCPANVPDMYEAGSGNRLDRAPPWLALRDPLHGDPGRQAVRATAVAHELGPIRDAWADVLHNDGHLFRRAFGVYLSYT